MKQSVGRYQTFIKTKQFTILPAQFMALDFNRSGSDYTLTLKGAQEAVDRWIREVGVNYFSELTNLAQLMEEVGELARVISRTYGDQSFKNSDRDVSLSAELADILFVLICLANQTGVDLTEEFRKNLEQKSVRDAERHRQNPKLKPI